MRKRLERASSCYLFAMFMPSVKWMEEEVNIALEEDGGREGRA